jgi:hypothetical protein
MLHSLEVFRQGAQAPCASRASLSAPQRFLSFCRPFTPACVRKAQRQPSLVAPRAQVETKRPGPDDISLRSIDGLDMDYCDDFQCTSSPAVEQTVRSLARELTRGR